MSATADDVAGRLERFADAVASDAYNADSWKAEDAASDAPFLRAAASLIRSQAARIEKLEAENAKLKQPEWFYSVEDPEYRSGGDVQDVVDDMDHEGVTEVAGAREVWKKWVAVRCLTVDDQGDIDDTEAATFDTVEEAKRCWPESLAACRARAALERT